MRKFLSDVGNWIKSLFCVHADKEPRLLTLSKKEGTRSFVSSLVCILAGVIVGFIVMMILALASSEDQIYFSDAFGGLFTMLAGPFTAANAAFSFGNMIFYAVPIIMTGLSVAIAFKTGLFNIGAAGQYFMGAMGSLLVALNINCTGNDVAGFFVWLLAIVVGMIFGMLWGCIPGLFKALFGVNEVIVCIMTNWIAANIVSWVFSSEGLKHLVNTGSGKSGYLIKTAVTNTGTPSLGLGKLFGNSYIDIGIFIAVALAIVIYIILNKTTFGYELKACGSNKHAAKYAGMNEKRNIILSMAIAGGLAAIGGALYYLNPGIELAYKAAYSKLPDNGFNGIPVALLASNNPIGVIFAGLLLRYLSQGGGNLSAFGFNQYVADIVVALIIYFAGFAKLIRDVLVNRQKKQTEKVLAKIANTVKNETDSSPVDTDKQYVIDEDVLTDEETQIDEEAQEVGK